MWLFFQIAFNFEVFCKILLPEYDWCCINSLSKDIFLKLSPNFIFQWNRRHFWKLVIKSAKCTKKIFFQHIFILITFNLNQFDWLYWFCLHFHYEKIIWNLKLKKVEPIFDQNLPFFKLLKQIYDQRREKMELKLWLRWKYM